MTNERDEDARESDRQRRIADACLAEGATPEGRLGLYRRLVQGNLAAVGRRLLPRTAALLDTAPGTSYAAWFARFLAERGPRTPYLRDVPGELVAWATPLWSAPPLPPNLLDVARYEAESFAIEVAVARRAPPLLTEIALERRLVFASPLTLARFDHAVTDPLAPPAATYLLLHRDEEHVVRTTPVAASVAPWLARLLAGAPLGAALAASDPPLREAERVEVARVLADLGERGVLLGGDAR